MLVQRVFPDGNTFGIPGRLYFDEQLVPLRSEVESQLLSVLRAAEVQYTPPVGEPAGERITPSPKALVLGEDIKHVLSREPEDNIRGLRDTIVEFVASPRFESFARREGEQAGPTRRAGDDVTNYIKVYIENMVKNRAFVTGHFVILQRELERLDPRDFEPEAQAMFIWHLARMHYVIQTLSTDHTPTISYLQGWLPILNKFRGQGSRGVQRSFAFLAGIDLRAIVERDYTELTLVLFPGAAWKSTVIIAGSILEAILFDVLTEPTRLPATLASPKKPSKGDITKGEWALQKLIEVAVDTGILPQDRAHTIDQVLRDYRNFVHPKKEIKAAHECTEAEAGLAKYALDGVCNHLEATL
jgi:hypothetical protein